MKNVIVQNLMENKNAICLTKSEAIKIWCGNKTKIINSKLYKTETNKLFYLNDDNFSYGIIRVHTPEKISLFRFSELKDEHLLTEQDRESRWPGKEILFMYNFDVVTMFNEPKKIVLNGQDYCLFRPFEFVDVNEELINDVASYDVDKANNEQLADDWRIVNAWYSTKKTGGNIKYSIEEIINLAGIIYREIVRRVKTGEMNHDFEPDKMKDLSKELYNIVSKNKTGINQEEINKLDLTDPKLVDKFEDKILIKDFISIVGSYAEQREGHIPNDLDLLIKMQSPPEFLRRSIEVRIMKDFGFSDKVHFIFDSSEGPHDNYIPLYDLKISRILPVKKVKMSKEIVEFGSIKFFEPMKPSKRFYDVNEAVNFMFTFGKKFSIEKKFNGLRCLLIKENNSVRLFTEQNKEITEHFPTIVAEANHLSNRDFIIDSELMFKDGGRSELLKFIVGKEIINDEDINLQVFDIPYYGKDITDLEWNERKQILHSLNFSKHIKEVSSIIINSKDQAEKAINLVRNLNKSEGAMIKDYYGKYTKNGESKSWIKFRNEDELTVSIIDVIEKDNGYVYNIGIKTDNNKINKDYIKNGYLNLGNTFVTKDKYNLRDNVLIRIEEVWRHNYNDGTFRYSIHKPTVVKKVESPNTTIEDLDKLAVSKGEQVIESSQTMAGETTTSDVSEVQGSEIKKEKLPNQKYVINAELPDDSREDVANDYWKNNWHNNYPKDGNGQFCLHPDTPIILNTGEVIRIKDAKPNDLILDKDGVTKILDVWESKWEKEITLSVSNIGEIKCSPTHKFLVCSNGSKIRRQYRERRWKALNKIEARNKLLKDNIVWKMASEISKDDLLLLKCPEGEQLPEELKITSDSKNQNELWELIGWYVAEGNIDRNYICLTQKKEIGIKRIKELLEKLNFEYLHYSYNNRADQFLIKDKKFYNIIFNYFNGYSLNKKIPLFMYSLNIEYLRSFINGHLAGDGTIDKRNCKLYSSSESLLMGLFLLLVKMKLGPTLMKDCVSFSRKEYYVDGIYQPSKHFLRSIEIDENLIGIRINNIVEENKEIVFIDIHTESETFLCPVITHNTFQHHWRGLTEEETKLSDAELMKGNGSVHGDMRFDFNPEELFGFTVFLGTTESNRTYQPDKFILNSKEKNNSKLQGTFKLSQPHSWLDVGDNGPVISEPTGVGSTSKGFSKFFKIDGGDYEIGVWREHMFELFIKGNKLNSRMIIQYAPVENDKRVWLVSWPEDQTPYAENHKLEEVISELKSKNQKYLIWNKPGDVPRKIEVDKYDEGKEAGTK